MALHELQRRLERLSGTFARTGREHLVVLLYAIFCTAVSILVTWGLYEHLQSSWHDAFLTGMFIVLLLMFGALAAAFIRRIDVAYVIGDGKIAFERPKGQRRWEEQLDDLVEITQGQPWFQATWIKLTFPDHTRLVEYLSCLEEALSADESPNNSFEPTRMNKVQDANGVRNDRR